MKTSREEFEEVYLSAPGTEERDIKMIDFSKGEEGPCYDYGSLEARYAWYWWQLSRESLEVQLYEPVDYCLPGDYWLGYEEGAAAQVEEIKESLIKQGIKIKGEDYGV